MNYIPINLTLASNFMIFSVYIWVSICPCSAFGNFEISTFVLALHIERFLNVKSKKTFFWTHKHFSSALLRFSKNQFIAISSNYWIIWCYCCDSSEYWAADFEFWRYFYPLLKAFSEESLFMDLILYSHFQLGRQFLISFSSTIETLIF